MRTSGFLAGSVLAAVVCVAALISPAPLGDKDFALSSVVPNDVFMFVGARSNPEREFLERYWGEVLEAAKQSGVCQDALDLLSGVLGAEHMAEVERLRNRAMQLIDGVEWHDLAKREMVFTERFGELARNFDGHDTFMMAEMVWIFRGSEGKAESNFDGMVAILEAIVDEINHAVGRDALAIQRNEQFGADVASVNLFGAINGAPRLPISVALHDGIIVVGLREGLFEDCLALLNGESSLKPLGADGRFKSAFSKLPPAEDAMVFFDMQALINPIRGFINSVVDTIGTARDVNLNTEMGPEAIRLNSSALYAYQAGDYEKALSLIEQAHEQAPESSIVLYNLACFSALAGKRDAALDWLDRAVEGGFYAPTKIEGDSDLDSLRNDPRYRETLAKAVRLAEEYRAPDITLNSSKQGEQGRLCMQAWEAYDEEDYERGLKLVEQAYAVAPKDSRVLYYLACFHALQGHDELALDFLERAVDGGFYCPRHIAKDPDLRSIRGEQRYDAALAAARSGAARHQTGDTASKSGIAKRMIDRIGDAAGILDYCATVETTDGFSTWSESFCVMVPDAKQRPIYPVFGKRAQLSDFDRYLPKETVSFAVAGGFDLGELYNFIEDTIRTAGPSGEELLENWEAIQKKIGVNIREDVISWLDGDGIELTLEDGSFVWFVKVNDEEVARKNVGAAIEFLSTKLTELVAENPALMGLAMMGVRTSPVEGAQLDGFQNIYLIMSPEPIAVWGVADGHLIIGRSAQAIELCLATARGEHPGIRENSRVMSEAIVPEGGFVSVSLTDQRKMGEDIATALGIGSMVTGMIGSMIPEPEVRPVLGKIAGMLNKLVPVARKINFYKSTATCTTFDGQAWHTRHVTHYFSPEERVAANN